MSLLAWPERAEVCQDEPATGRKGEKDVLSMSRGRGLGTGKEPDARGLRVPWLSPVTAPWWRWLQCLPLHSGTVTGRIQPGDGEHSRTGTGNREGGTALRQGGGCGSPSGTARPGIGSLAESQGHS